ncbi:tyrosine-type recombinase/integrase [Evansella clarkii]|uniref:tyrosine-type recombinase/integrase n=1 Tax=Evansella clarkii TaxID=79879 RepID=UPI001472C43E|nr:site-specific integrase [Evansella clarkii]
MENWSLLERYIQYLEDKGRKPGTVKQYVSDLKQFITWLDSTADREQDLLKIDGAHIEAYTALLNEKKLSRATIKRHLSAINRLLAYYRIDHVMPEHHTTDYSAPPLKRSDFVTIHEMHQLLTSMKRPIGSAARDILIHRNLAIVHLIRYKGFRPKEVSLINMNMINMGQSQIALDLYDPEPVYHLSDEHMQYIRDYLQTIDAPKRPRRQSSDPLFVAFNNRSNHYQFDYELVKPKRLSVRGIQKMIKEEVQHAGIRKLSAKHLRNSCILEHVMRGYDEKDIQSYFHLTHPHSLYRYKEYGISENP